MAYFLQHPEGNANIYSRTRSSPPRPTGTATLPPINVRRHYTCLPTVSLSLKTPKGTKKNSSLITVNVLHTRFICFIGGASFFLSLLRLKCKNPLPEHFWNQTLPPPRESLILICAVLKHQTSANENPWLFCCFKTLSTQEKTQPAFIHRAIFPHSTSFKTIV